MRISVAQLNYHVGNFDLNTKLIIDAIQKAINEKADLVVFSELAITAYPPHDLLENEDFIKKSADSIAKIAPVCRNITAIIGCPVINKESSGKRLFNAAVVISDTKIVGTIKKSLLPTYDIFDEYRYFEPNSEFDLVEVAGKKIAVTICEDLWDEQGFDNEFSSSRMYKISPMDELEKLNPDLIVNLSASPYSSTREEMRTSIFTGKAAKHRLPLIMCNQVGGNTELVFEGASLIVCPDGAIHDSLDSFKEDFRTYNFEDIKASKETSKPPENERISSIYEALVLGTRDYFRKMNFSSAILGLSGGIDSAVCLCILADALGSEKVRVLMLPSMYSSQHSVDDAVALAENLEVQYDIVGIEDTYYSTCKALKPLFEGQEEDVTEENIQARIRAVLLMAVSNKFGNILINTSNKSEAAVGYGTLYGDMAGGLSILGDVYKKDVFRLSHYINRDKEVIPTNTITKPPSAELKPDQKDSDSLPDYDLLDSILFQYIELQKPLSEIKGEGINDEILRRVINLINTNEYKRFQAPPILRISSKAFGYGRRMPLVARYSLI